eukprot:1248522-Pleurochrysis_carterae.AAC.1
MHGLCHHLRGDPDPTALMCPSPFMDRQLRRWRVRLTQNNCTPLLAVATPLPQQPLRGLQAAPT